MDRDLPEKATKLNQGRTEGLPSSTAPRSEYTRKTRGLKLKNLDPSTTHKNLDPPPYRYFNCWGKHAFFNCERPRRKICENCDRRRVTIMDGPHCGRVYRWRLEDRWFRGRTGNVTSESGFHSNSGPAVQVPSTSRPALGREATHGSRKKYRPGPIPEARRLPLPNGTSLSPPSPTSFEVLRQNPLIDHGPRRHRVLSAAAREACVRQQGEGSQSTEPRNAAMLLPRHP